MRPTTFVLALVPLSLLAAGSAALAVQDDAKAKPDPARLFASQCASCHAVPDTDVATDRAWLDQVRRTA